MNPVTDSTQLFQTANRFIPGGVNSLVRAFKGVGGTPIFIDSRILITVVLAGDGRLTANLRRDELLPLGSRIRTRLILEYANRDELMAGLKHLQVTAGNASRQ